MFKAYVMPALAGAFLLSLATAAWAANGEFGNMCAMSLAAGKDTQTDCSINGQYLGQNLLLRQCRGHGRVHEEPQG